MEIKEFRKYARNLSGYSASDVDEFTFMTEEELDEYQDEVEQDTGNTSNWDDCRAIITFRKIIEELSEKIEYMQKNNEK
jgi:hypothetical protein